MHGQAQGKQYETQPKIRTGNRVMVRFPNEVEIG